MGSGEERWAINKLTEVNGALWKPNPEIEDQRIYCNVKVPNGTGPVTPVVIGEGHEL